MSASLLTFTLPDPGEGLTEAEVIRWLIGPGDLVAVNQPVVEIETAKSVVELPSPFDGTVEALVAAEGAVVPVGSPILQVRPTGSGKSGRETAPAAPSRASSAARQPVLVGYGPATASPGFGPAPAPPAVEPPSEDRSQASATRRPADTAPGTTSRSGPGPVNPSGRSARAKAKPPVRALARRLGIELSQVAPSGAEGVVTRADVTAWAAANRTGTAPVAPGGAESPAATGERREPIRSVRRATAAAMVESAFSAPHASLFVEVDATRGLAFARRSGLGLLSLTAFALVRSAMRHPVINASWDQAAGEIVYHDYVGLGLAVDSPRGLLVPCVRRADRMALPELAGAVAGLVATVRAGSAKPEDMTGGTITLTNVGTLGVDGGSPILVPGQVAILAVGAIRPRPWVHKGKLKPRRVGRLTLTFDHRLVDGADAANAVRDVAAVLERPETALT